MAKRYHHIAFTQGLNQGVDRWNAPDGSLLKAENVWFDRDGRLTKARRRDMTKVSTGTTEKRCMFVGSANETNLACIDGVVYAEDRQVDSGGTSSWNEIGKIPTLAPLDSFFASETAGYQVSQVSAQVFGDYIVVAYKRADLIGTTNLIVRTWNLTTRALVATRDFGSGTERCYVVSSTTARAPTLVFRGNGGADIVALNADTPTSGAPKYTGTPTTLFAGLGSESFFASEGLSSNTTIAIAKLTGGTQLDLYSCDYTTLAAPTLRQTYLGITQDGFECRTFGDVTFVAIRAATAQIATYNATTFAAISAPTTIDATGADRIHLIQDPNPAGANAQAIVVWSETNSGVQSVLARAVDQALATGPAMTLAERGNIFGGGFSASGKAFVWIYVEASKSAVCMRLDVDQIGASAKTSYDRMAYLHSAGLTPAPTLPAIKFPSCVYSSGDFTLGPGPGFLISILPEYTRFAPHHDDQGAKFFIFAHPGNRGPAQMRQILEHNGAALIPGGQLMQVSGGLVQPQLPLHPPTIESSVKSAGGFLEDSSTYQYVAVWEYTDQDGNLHQSAPSAVRPVTMLAGQTQVTIGVDYPIGFGPSTKVVANLYRTAADGSIFYRQTGSDPTSPRPVAPGGTRLDNCSDNNLTTAATLYTEGGTLDADPAPSCRFGTSGKRRMALGGLFQANRVQFSTLSATGVPPSFPNDPAFQIDFPAAVTGLAFIDDVFVVFTSDRIFLVTGDGPDDTGVGEFQTRELPASVGCHLWGSVIATDDGVFFGSYDGLYLLPRGFGPPINVGARFQDELRTTPNIVSATICHDREAPTVRFACAPVAYTSGGWVMVYHLRNKEWTKFTYNSDATPFLTGVHYVDTFGDGFFGNVPVYATISSITKNDAGTHKGLILQERGTGVKSEETVSGRSHIISRVEMADIHPWGLAGQAKITGLYLTYTWAGACSVSLNPIYNGAAGADASSIEYDTGWRAKGEATVQGVGSAAVQRLEWINPAGTMHAFRATLSDLAPSGVTPYSAGIDYIGFSIEWDYESGPQQPTFQRS